MKSLDHKRKKTADGGPVAFPKEASDTEKTRKAASKTRKSSHLEAGDERFMQLVADYAAHHPGSARDICKELEKCHGLKQDENDIYRAAFYAARRGLLRPNPPLDSELSGQLSELFVGQGGAPIEIAVVSENGDFGGTEACFYTACAQVLDNLIRKRLRKVSPDRMLIANAGGPALRKTVRALAWLNSTGPAEGAAAANLLSISLCRAGSPDQFDLTSSHLAVCLSDIYKGRHYVPVTSEDEDSKEYKDILKKVHLFIGGVGCAEKGFVTERARSLQIALPDNTGYIGDIFYLPLDEQALPVKNDEIDRILAPLRLHPSHHELNACIRRDGRVLLLAGDSEPYPKDKIIHAVLSNRLATDVVLSAGLARAVLEARARIGLTRERPATGK